MNVRDLCLETWEALKANKGRSILTILGIVIGITAVISMTSLIGGIQNTLSSSLGLERSKLIYVTMYQDKDSWSEADIAKIKSDIPTYRDFMGVAMASDTIPVSTGVVTAQVTGISKGYLSAQGIEIIAGSSFANSQYAEGSDVIMLDKTSVKELFELNSEGVIHSKISASATKQEVQEADSKPKGNSSAPSLSAQEEKSLCEQAIGKTIRLKGRPYTIVGIAESANMPSLGFAGKTVQLFTPLKTLQMRMSHSMSCTELLGVVADKDKVEETEKRTKEWISSRFNYKSDKDAPNKMPNFAVQSVEGVTKGFNSFMSGFQMMVGCIAGISLLVGGIGIMNMMLTNVSERIREIGLRKALGAKRHDITKQFLLESVCLCVTGGIIGMLLGFLCAQGLAVLVSMFMQMHVNAAIDAKSVGLAVGICVCIGIIFGFYPARRAAMLDPVESLHYQ